MTWYHGGADALPFPEWTPESEDPPPDDATLAQVRQWARLHDGPCPCCGRARRRLPDRGRAHAEGHDTEHEAASSVADLKGKRLAAYELLVEARQHGLTDDEGGERMGGDRLTFGRRRQELCLQGRVKDSGQRRRTPTGRNAVVWVVT